MVAANAGPRPVSGAHHRDWLDTLGRPATLLMIAALLVSAAVLLSFEQGITFRLDEWTFLLNRPGFTADSILLPHNEHIVVGPVLTYKALIALFGTDSARPFQVVQVATFIASVALLFAWLRRRIDEWLALAGCLPILFLGAASEDLLWPFQMGFFGSMATGIGMFLALDRPSRRGDLVAAVLLFTSLAWSSLGLAFTVAAAVFLVVTGNPLRRAWVVVIPFALYIAWYAGWGHTAQNSLSVHNALSSPGYIFDGFAASIASLFGLVTAHESGATTLLNWGRVLLVAGVIGACVRIWKLRSVPKTFWVVVALGIAFWFLAALNAGPDRAATSGRYQYIGAIVVVMIAAELLRGVRPSRLALGGVFTVCAVVLISSISCLHSMAQTAQHGGNIVRADLAAVEIARDTVASDFVPNPGFSGTGDVYIPAGLYLALADDTGSPAFDLTELADAPDYARAFADATLANAEMIGLDPAAAGGGTGDCKVVQAGAGNAVALGPGTVVLEAAPGSSLEVYLRRYAEASFPVNLGKLGSGERASVTIPADRSDVSWHLAFSGDGQAKLCVPA